MRKVLWFGVGLTALAGIAGPAQAQRKGEMRGRAAWSAADPTTRRRIRLNRGLFNLVGQNPRVSAVCGPAGARHVRTKANGWDALFSFVTVGMYTPQHSYIVCNGPTLG
jgi:hypothetical protein